MRKYFIKFIPVTGKPNEGDFVIGGPGDEAYKEIWQWDGESHLSEEDNRVKPFVCSRDLRVGGIISSDLLDDINNFYDYFPTVEDENHLNRLDERFYRVVGEVSDGAIGYVKDGQELDLDDIVFHYNHRFFRDKDFVSLDGEWEEDDWDRSKYDCVVKIIGPCGHLH